MYTDSAAEFLRHLVAASLQAAALGLAVWMACHFLGRHLAARWRCGLWGLVIVRLAWPFSISSPVSLFNLWLLPKRWVPSDWLPRYLPDELFSTMDAWLGRSWIVWIWLIVAIFLTVRLVCAWLWTVWLRHRAQPLEKWSLWLLLRRCEILARIERPVAISQSTQVDSPCLVGMVHPHLLIPRKLVDTLNENEIKLIFLHELAHLRRRDLAVNWVLASVEIIHWYNPLVWIVSREVRAAREEACDACALETEPGASRAYGETLLKLLENEAHPAPEPPPMTLAACMAGNSGREFSQLAHRLRAIARYRPGTRTWIVGTCTWLAMAMIGLTDADITTPPDCPPSGEAADSPLSDPF